MADIIIFQTTEVYQFARRKAVYGHRDWLVWKLADGTYKTARICQEVVELAMKECAENDKGKPIVTCVQQNVGHYLHVHRALANVWLENMKANQFAY